MGIEDGVLYWGNINIEAGEIYLSLAPPWRGHNGAGYSS